MVDGLEQVECDNIVGEGRRDWFEWEKSQLVDFMLYLTQQALHTKREDKWLWRDPHTNIFFY